MPQGGRHPPVDPCDIVYQGMYKYHGVAQVRLLGTRYQSYMYVGSEGGTPRARLMANGGSGALLCACIRSWISIWGYGGAWGGHIVFMACTMKVEGQARLELPQNPGCAYLDFCTCATGCRVHMV